MLGDRETVRNSRAPSCAACSISSIRDLTRRYPSTTSKRKSAPSCLWVGLPPYALSRAMRKLTIWLVSHLTERQLPQATLVEAVIHIVDTIGLSLEIREISYQEHVETRARIDEAYRLYSLGQNLAIEREHQRALLRNGRTACSPHFINVEGSRTLPKLWSSESGLWLNHKARFSIRKSAAALVDPLCGGSNRPGPGAGSRKGPQRGSGSIAFLITHIEEQLSAIRFGLNGIFDLHRG